MAEFNKSRYLAVLAWGTALAAAVVLGYERFTSAMASPDRMDFDVVFLPAAQAVAAGGSPYDLPGYVYSPLYAVLLAPIANQPWAAAATTAVLIACGLGACFIIARSAATRWQAGAICLLAVVTLLYSWPATFNLWGLHPELPVLLCLAVAVTTRGAAAGFALGMGAVIKTWPAVLGLWLVTLPDRLKAFTGFVVAGLVAVVLALFVAGPSGPLEMVRVAFDAKQQPLVAYSTTGAARLLFTRNPNAEPLIESPVLAMIVAVVLSLWVLFLLVTVIRTPGPRPIALFNLAFVVILLLPVSHYPYLFYPLPALWLWAGRALRGDRVSMVAAGVLSAWWLIALRLPPSGDWLTQTLPSFLAIFLSTLVAASTSVLLARRVHVHSPDVPQFPQSKPAPQEAPRG